MTNKQHKDMWLEIAIAFWARYDNNYTERQWGISSSGLCYALNKMGLNMLGYAFFFECPRKRWGYYGDGYYLIDEHDKLSRSDLAYLFSTMSVKEFESIVGYKYNGEKING